MGTEPTLLGPLQQAPPALSCDVLAYTYQDLSRGGDPRPTFCPHQVTGLIWGISEFCVDPS